MRVWAIGSQDSLASLQAFRDQLGISMTILHDQGGDVRDLYNVGKGATNSVYPEDWIIGVDGTVRYVNNSYDPVGMSAVIEAELAK